jgi:hypothetical protein
MVTVEVVVPCRLKSEMTRMRKALMRTTHHGVLIINRARSLPGCPSASSWLHCTLIDAGTCGGGQLNLLTEMPGANRSVGSLSDDALSRFKSAPNRPQRTFERLATKFSCIANLSACP